MRISLLVTVMILGASAVVMAAPPKTGRVTAERLNLRQGPGSEHPVLGALERGAQVRIEAEQGGWCKVRVERAGQAPLVGWVAAQYIARDADDSSDEGRKPADPAATPKGPGEPAKPGPPEALELPRDRATRLQFIKDPRRSTLDFLGEQGKRLRAFPWHESDYPGAPKGPNEAQSEALADALRRLWPERRVNTGSARLPFDWPAIEPRLIAVPEQAPYRLHTQAVASYVRMRAAAAQDGVTLTLVSAARSPEHQKRLAGNNPNPAAVAQGVSAHNYGLAIDLALSPGNPEPLKEVTTRPFANVIAMRASPVHKWMVCFGSEHGWYPYTNEPWHWEFNPPTLKEQFP